MYNPYQLPGRCKVVAVDIADEFYKEALTAGDVDLARQWAEVRDMLLGFGDHIVANIAEVGADEKAQS